MDSRYHCNSYREGRGKREEGRGREGRGGERGEEERGERRGIGGGEEGIGERGEGSTFCCYLFLFFSIDAEFTQTNYTPVAHALVHEGFYSVCVPRSCAIGREREREKKEEGVE